MCLTPKPLASMSLLSVVVVVVVAELKLASATLRDDRDVTQKGGQLPPMAPLSMAVMTTTMTDGNHGKAGGSSVKCILATSHSDKYQARPPMDHFRRLLEEGCPNHSYAIRRKLKNCGMMRSFMTLGSLTMGVKLDVGLDERDTTTFPEGNVIMMVYGGQPHRGGAACLA
jgi:hypothetical protein